MKGISEEVMKFSIEKFERADLEHLEREIGRLTAENERLREVLREAPDMLKIWETGDLDKEEWAGLAFMVFQTMATALKEAPNDS